MCYITLFNFNILLIVMHAINVRYKTKNLSCGWNCSLLYRHGMLDLSKNKTDFFFIESTSFMR